MAMPVKDFRQLEKLMMMTTSDIDAEALSALRKSNEILKRHGYTWTSAFQRLVKVERGMEAYTEEPAQKDESLTEARRRTIREAFNDLEAVEIRGGDAEFVESLEDWFTKKGFLTDAQREGLFAIRNRLTR